MNEIENIENLEDAWNNKKVKFKKPKRLLAFFQSNWYIVLDDDKTVFRFVGKIKKPSIYVAVKSKCIKQKTKNGINIYLIKDQDALQIIADTAIIALDTFGIDTLSTIFYKKLKTPSPSKKKKQEEESEEDEDEESEEEEEEEEISSPKIKIKTPKKKQESEEEEDEIILPLIKNIKTPIKKK
jgi:hypothetical protein